MRIKLRARQSQFPCGSIAASGTQGLSLIKYLQGAFWKCREVISIRRSSRCTCKQSILRTTGWIFNGFVQQQQQRERRTISIWTGCIQCARGGRGGLISLGPVSVLRHWSAGDICRWGSELKLRAPVSPQGTLVRDHWITTACMHI